MTLRSIVVVPHSPGSARRHSRRWLSCRYLTRLGYARCRSHGRPLAPNEARRRCPRGELELHVVIVVTDEAPAADVFETVRGSRRWLRAEAAALDEHLEARIAELIL